MLTLFCIAYQPNAFLFSEMGTFERNVKKVIRGNVSFLKKHIPPEIVTDVLVEEGVITFSEQEKILSLSSQDERGRQILWAIDRHPKGYTALLKGLDHPDSDTDWMASRIRSYMDNIKGTI